MAKEEMEDLRKALLRTQAALLKLTERVEKLEGKADDKRPAAA